MTPTEIGGIGIAALLALLALRMPIGLAVLIVGFGGMASLVGWKPALSTLSGETFVMATFYELAVIPLFILMGNLANISGMGRDLYYAAYTLVGRFSGGLASSTIIGCAGFAAMSGSSLASAVTMGRISLPEMRRYNYSDSLATGTVAAGGTLGILIPPSTGFVVYAILTEQSIGRLFIAGVLPGIVLTLLFIVTIVIITRIWSDAGPSGESRTLVEKGQALVRAGPIVTIVLLTIGGIYGGIFTPVEAAGIGAFLAALVALGRRSLNFQNVEFALLQTIRTTATLFLIVIGAHVFTPFVALTNIPAIIADSLVSLSLGATETLILIILIYIGLGMFLEVLAMLVLTLPIFFPLIVQLGFDPIWFGVIIVVVMEMGMISPPVGINVFAVQSISGGVPLWRIFIGILPFWVAMAVCLLLLVVWPNLALYLPNTMFS